MSPSHTDLETLLQEQFGYDAFRPGQERIIRKLLDGQDVLAVLSTGAGKSLVFQLASQLLPGLTLVVSPLLALMKDQVDSIQERGLGAGAINSMQSASQCEVELEKAQRSEQSLLYVTPERLENSEFLDSLARTQVSLLVVDEAHCVSEWGFDFRPAYLHLRSAAERLGRPTMLALTATATPRIRQDIVERLGLRDPDIVVRDVDRPNLLFEVKRVLTEEEEARTLHSILFDEPEAYTPEVQESVRAAMHQSGIIYTATTRAAEETAAWLREWGIAADFYHGQRSRKDRIRVQDDFMQGRLRVIAATNAFGMGVDKPDIGFVIHRDIPASVEAYFQEAGRAGRDGQPARCTLIYRTADLGKAAFLSGSAHLTPEDVEKVCACLSEAGEFSIRDLMDKTGFGKTKMCRLVEILAQQGLVQEDGSRLRLTVNRLDPTQVSLRAEENRIAFEQSRLGMMRAYAELRDCRRRFLINYFGQETETAICGMCDNDFTGTPEQDIAQVEEAQGVPLTIGQRVSHSQWGEGRVTGLNAEIVAVDFKSQGEKRLAANLVLDGGILQPLINDGVYQSVSDGSRPLLHVGERILHPAFGEGEVQHSAGSSVMVLFREGGYKTLSLDECDAEQMLKVG